MITYEFQSATSQLLTASDIVQINVLLKQLDSNAKPMGNDYLREIISRSYFLIAREEGKQIIGMGTLVPVIAPVHRGSRIEDVVVEQSWRGQGIGKEITLRLITKAKELKIEHIDLTSHPSRTAANQLYQKLGWQQGETNVYRLKL